MQDQQQQATRGPVQEGRAAQEPARGGQEQDGQERDLRQAMWRGWRRRCPNCGSGPLMKGYLQVRPQCPVCGEELHHHRADDGPAYLTILIVGHLMAPLILWAFLSFRPDPLVLATIFAIGSVTLSLYLLPRLKGLIVGIQWAKRMGGFDDEEEPGAPEETPRRQAG